MNGYQNSLSMAIQIVYHPLSKCIINYFQADHQHLFKWIISDHQVDNRPLSKRYINGYPNGLSMAIQIVYHPLSKCIINYFQANHQHLFKWIISHHQVDNRPLSKRFMNGYPNGLSMAIRIVYHPKSKWIINYFPSESSTSIQVDYQQPSSG